MTENLKDRLLSRFSNVIDAVQTLSLLQKDISPILNASMRELLSNGVSQTSLKDNSERYLKARTILSGDALDQALAVAAMTGFSISASEIAEMDEMFNLLAQIAGIEKPDFPKIDFLPESGGSPSPTETVSEKAASSQEDDDQTPKVPISALIKKRVDEPKPAAHTQASPAATESPATQAEDDAKPVTSSNESAEKTDTPGALLLKLHRSIRPTRPETGVLAMASGSEEAETASPVAETKKEVEPKTAPAHQAPPAPSRTAGPPQPASQNRAPGAPSPAKPPAAAPGTVRSATAPATRVRTASSNRSGATAHQSQPQTTAPTPPVSPASTTRAVNRTAAPPRPAAAPSTASPAKTTPPATPANQAAPAQNQTGGTAASSKDEAPWDQLHSSSDDLMDDIPF